MAAALRMPGGHSAADRAAAVDSIIKKLSLTQSADTVIGNEKKRGLSGGEKKRLSIACELIGSPKLLFLDEPTSGLDSFQAEKVRQHFVKLCSMQVQVQVLVLAWALCACMGNLVHVELCVSACNMHLRCYCLALQAIADVGCTMQVVATLKQLAEEGHTVVCSIHQPRSSIYAMFDDLMLLSEGRCIYAGAFSFAVKLSR